jgi:hypothetical protein
MAKVVWQDVRNLKTLGLNGLINCQSLRVFFPNGLGMTVLGRTLWNDRLDFDKLAEDYFLSAYGKDGPICSGFMVKAQQAVSATDKAIGRDAATARKNIDAIRAELHDFAPVVERNVASETGGRRISWQMMGDYLKTMDFYASYAEESIRAEGQGVQTIRNRFQQFAYSLEGEYQPYVRPVEYFNRYMK